MVVHWTSKCKKDGCHGTVLAKGGMYSNLQSEGHSGSCVEAGEGMSRSWRTSKETVVFAHK